jgi:hypothetical protein
MEDTSGSSNISLEGSDENELETRPMTAGDSELLDRELALLYDEFIGPYAVNELNLTSNCKNALAHAREHGTLTMQSFEPARYEILQLLFQNTWPRMLRSQMH